MEGGSTQHGCGYNDWLYSCCLQNAPTTVKKRNPNYDHLSKLKRQDDLQNSFSRRRYDSSENLLVPTCGVPRTPSNILQRRIIGGRPAYFAEFPWQSHIRIQQYQCGGGNTVAFPQSQKWDLQIAFSSCLSEVCCHCRPLCIARETAGNRHLSRRARYTGFGWYLRAPAFRKAFSDPEIRPSPLSVSPDTTRSIRCCGFKASKASGLQVNNLFNNRWKFNETKKYISERIFCQFACRRYRSIRLAKVDISLVGERLHRSTGIQARTFWELLRCRSYVSCWCCRPSYLFY